MEMLMRKLLLAFAVERVESSCCIFFSLGNENDAFLLLLKANRTIYKSFILS